MRKSNFGKKNPLKKLTKKAKVTVAGVIGIVLLGAAIGFFSYYKVDSVEVRGTTHYTEDEIKKMVLKGSFASNSVLAPLFCGNVDTSDVAFVDAFKITQLNRNTICISVKEKKPIGCIHYLDSYIYFDRTGTFVEGSQTLDKTVPYFDAVEIRHCLIQSR